MLISVTRRKSQGRKRQLCKLRPFFSRTIIMEKKHECRFKGSCNVRGGSRCRSCRYDQCILAGMDASAIRFPNGFNVDSAIQEVNKRKRVLIESNGNDAVIIPVKVSFTSQIINFGLSNYFWKILARNYRNPHLFWPQRTLEFQSITRFVA